ncbi:MAG: DUF2062 domain-containing protein [Bacillota bacterium]
MIKRLRDNRLTRHILDLLKQGITPQKIALAVVLGVLLGIAPVLGTTIVSCTLAALALGLNLPLIQLVNNLVYPLQLLLLIPFVQAGQRLFGEAPLPLSVSQIVGRFEKDFWGSVVAFWSYTWHGATAWLLFSAVAGPVLYFLLLLPLKRLMPRKV